MTRRPALARLAGAAALLACASALAGTRDFIDLRRIDALRGDANAGKEKSAVCSACHGAAGIAPASAFPNLAGQHAEYLYWQLVEFQREARPESPMTSQVAHLDDATLRDLAAWFASLPPQAKASGAAPTGRGAAIWREGDPAHGTPPCQGCHGADGKGHPWANEKAGYRTYPVLRGQHADYVVQRLKDFRDGKHVLSSSDRVMTPVARTLDDDAIAAVAAWIESAPD
ncbi:MAG TPA: c-type cytochrome [Rhodanobacteraceae bacterium]|nr:c-type cytochrome [Rhodanobacteraceae bacterium]